MVKIEVTKSDIEKVRIYRDKIKEYRLGLELKVKLLRKIEIISNILVILNSIGIFVYVYKFLHESNINFEYSYKVGKYWTLVFLVIIVLSIVCRGTLNYYRNTLNQFPHKRSFFLIYRGYYIEITREKELILSKIPVFEKNYHEDKISISVNFKTILNILKELDTAFKLEVVDKSVLDSIIDKVISDNSLLPKIKNYEQNLNQQISDSGKLD